MTPYSWMVKGFGGLVQMAEKMSEQREPMEDVALLELESFLARLKRVVEIQKKIKGDRCH